MTKTGGRVKDVDRQFQDGHEVLQYFVRGYQIPETDYSAIDAVTETGKDDNPFSTQIVGEIRELVRQFERSDSRAGRPRKSRRRP
jgi:hypothetical protein